MAMTPEQRFSQQLAMLAKPQADALMLRMLYDHRVMGEKLGVVAQWCSGAVVQWCSGAA